MREIERLKQAVSMAPTRREIWLAGKEFTFWMTPLTLAEKQRAQKNALSEDVTEYALQLLVAKAKDDNGQLLYNIGDVPELRNVFPLSELEKLLVMIVRGGEEEEEGGQPLDMKSDKEATGKRRSAAS